MPAGVREAIGQIGSGSGTSAAISGTGAVGGSSSNKGETEHPPRSFGTGRTIARHRPRTITSRNTGGAKTASKINPLSGAWKPSSHSLCDGRRNLGSKIQIQGSDLADIELEGSAESKTGTFRCSGNDFQVGIECPRG